MNIPATPPETFGPKRIEEISRNGYVKAIRAGEAIIEASTNGTLDAVALNALARFAEACGNGLDMTPPEQSYE